ncbi:MAG: hypothetical protein ACYDEY_08560 [Acidimicrobiales bacterium]
MLPIAPGPSQVSSWTWEIRPEDIETVDKARSTQASAPIFFYVDISGIAKVLDEQTGQFRDFVPIRGGDTQLQVELSQWERLLQALG